MTLKILNLYAGIGGNRKLWSGDIEVTAIEKNPEIAKIYMDNFPQDFLMITDAHDYLLHNFMNFDFIWSSPPCPTHSKLRTLQKEKVYPDMTLYQEIIFLTKWFKDKWVVENVEPYYEPLIKPQIIHRHAFWSNFLIPVLEFEKMKTCKIEKEREFLQSKIGFNLDKYTGIDKRLILRNCVLPELGLHIFNCAFIEVQQQQKLTLLTGSDNRGRK